MIFQLANLPLCTGDCLVYFYGELFKFLSAHKETIGELNVFTPCLGIDMFILEHHKHLNGARMGDIFPLMAVWEIMELVPQFCRQRNISHDP